GRLPLRRGRHVPGRRADGRLPAPGGPRRRGDPRRNSPRRGEARGGGAARRGRRRPVAQEPSRGRRREPREDVGRAKGGRRVEPTIPTPYRADPESWRAAAASLERSPLNRVIYTLWRRWERFNTGTLMGLEPVVAGR